MEFRTVVELPDDLRGLVAHGQQIWTVGSCFADTVGERLRRDLFQVEVNPFGPLYNPVSIADALTRVATAKRYTATDLLKNQGMWHSWDFHSRFSSYDSARVLANINGTMERLASQWGTLKVLILTFGSTRAFRLRSTGQVVANCHKVPQENFEAVSCSASKDWLRNLCLVLQMLKGHNPDLKVILTVSPIRHIAYGLHDDRLQKSYLCILADQMSRLVEFINYFPAYEIMTDELRDYRFYAADMVHPTDVAVDYIYERFGQTFYDEPTARLAQEARRLTRRFDHRPLTDDPDTVARWRASTVEAARKFAAEHPSVAQAVDQLITTYQNRNSTKDNG